jgi:hypothetical protein
VHERLGRRSRRHLLEDLRQQFLIG